MNLLIVTPHFPPTHVGGVESSVKAYAEWMSRAGHRVDVVCVEHITGGDGVEATSEHGDGYSVHRLTLGISNSQDFRLLHAHDGVRVWCEDLMRQRQSDVVHVHSGYLIGAPALAAARTLGVRTVLTLHDYWFVCPRITLLQPSGACCTGPEGAAKCAWCLHTEQRRYLWADRATGNVAGTLGRALMRASLVDTVLTGRLERRAETLREVMRSTDVVLAPSEFLRTMMTRAGIPADRIQVLRTGVEPLARSDAPRSPGAPLRIGYVGRIVEPKGIHVLFKAVRSLAFPDWELSVHGPTDVDARYTSLLTSIAEGDTRIRFAGPFAASRQSEVFSTFDVLVVPSIWYENRPIVMLEALSAGVPVVASRLGGMAELIDHDRTGLLFEPGNPVDLARQLTRIRQEPGLVDTLTSDTTVPTFADELAAVHAIYQRLAG